MGVAPWWGVRAPDRGSLLATHRLFHTDVGKQLSKLLISLLHAAFFQAFGDLLDAVARHHCGELLVEMIQLFDFERDLISIYCWSLQGVACLRWEYG